ncbi:hypothetical protein [Kitasatospora sp. NPDC058478]|uniref:response regulator transcription factor n=1 Tax=unclassified Kitasatospora TaxID=2633591 RepID=UPI0036697B35
MNIGALSLPTDESVHGDPCQTCGDRIVLTQREHDVLVLTATGDEVRQVGKRLGLGRTTVQKDLARLRGRTGARTASHLAAIGVRAGLVPLLVPHRHPGRLTSRQVLVASAHAEGLSADETSEVGGFKRDVVFRTQRDIRQMLGVPNLCAALTMLYSLGELARTHPCPTPACTAARHAREQHPDNLQDARNAALHWAADTSLAARLRAENRRARAQLASTVSKFNGSLAELGLAQHDAQQALHETEALRRQTNAATTATNAMTAGLDALRHQAQTAAEDVANLRYRAHELHQAYVALKRGQEDLQRGEAELEKGRRRLMDGWQELTAARDQARAALPVPDPAQKRPVRAPIPHEDRYWHRQPRTT